MEHPQGRYSYLAYLVCKLRNDEKVGAEDGGPQKSIQQSV